MSLGRKIQQLRLQANRTQREVSESTGIAVSYLSRLENGRITPSIGTLSKISDSFRVPLSVFFDGGEPLEPGDRCPISASGRCILDRPFVTRGRRAKSAPESYSRQQLEALRMCNLLLQKGGPQIVSSLALLLKALLALAAAKDNPKLEQILRALRLTHG